MDNIQNINTDDSKSNSLSRSRSSSDDLSDNHSDISSHTSSNNDESDNSSTYYSKSSESSIETTIYAKDAIFGNQVYKNILFENKFSNILKFLEFTSENRGISQKHVDDIYNHYLNNPDQYIKPLDILCYYENGMDTDHFYVADGQHRFMALKKLLDNDNIDKNILYFIHDVKSDEDIRKTIKYLNSSNPVNSIYSFEKTPDFIKKIESKYTNIFSDNTNHNNDKINKIKLRDHIDEIKLFDGEIYTVDFVFNKLLDFNKKVKEEFLNRENKIPSDKKLFDRLSETHQFYSLIYRNYTWINEFYNFIRN